jgi:protease PrsW
VSSLGLTSREFRFTRRDFLLFTFFITLGFVTLENIIYMIQEIERGALQVFFTGMSRLLFSLPLHVFAASVCVMMWWKALSYRFFSWQYIGYFSLGYIIATLIHGAYNTFLASGYIAPVIVLVALGYIAFTQWIIEE